MSAYLIDKNLQPILDKWQWQNAVVTPLVQDASFRHYFRLQKASKTAILMVAPPPTEDLPLFIKITQHLARLGVKVPAIYQYDLQASVALIEDLGKDTFTELLAKDVDEKKLYQQAIDRLIQLQQHPQATQIDVNHYDWHYFLTEIKLFVEWFLPFLLGKKPSRQCAEEFELAWQEIHASLPIIFDTLVLRDFHVDNLMLKNDQCVLLDYQDALIGSPVYDLVSLLEDARRDVSTDIVDDVIQQYQQTFSNLSQTDFQKHYTIWGAQRHCKVCGIFVRLAERDRKRSYLQHLPRVLKLLQQKTHDPILRPFKQWLIQYDIDLTLADK